MTVETKRGTQMGSICGGGTPTRMRSNAVGGVNSYFMLGVGGCNYDASTVSLLADLLTCLSLPYALLQFGKIYINV